MHRPYRYFEKEESRKDEMAVATRRWFDDRLPMTRHRDSWWGKDDWLDGWHDWPKDWPQPREMMGRFYREPDNWWKDWPVDWPRMDAVMPRMTTHLDRLDRNWRNDPFWMDIYPRWAEPIFKDGIDVHSNITNDERRFAVDIDCYQFKPEEIQVKTLDDTLMIEGRHEDVKDRDNFTKMYFVRKYQLPTDVDIHQVQSSIDARGRLTVEAPRRHQALTGRERMIPIEGPSRSYHSSPRGRDSAYSSHASPIHVNTGEDRGREIRINTDYGRESRGEQREYNHSHSQSRSESRGGLRDIRDEIREKDYGRDRDLLSPDDGYTTHSYSYRRSESRSRLNSPHEVTMANENRAYTNGGDRRGSYDRDGFRSQSRGAEVRESSSRSASRQEYRDGYQSDGRGYRVDSPASSTTGILKNGASPRGTESVRSVQILKKTY